MRVRYSLTIKQMATVSAVAVVTIMIFIVIQLFHFVHQRRDDYAQQLMNIAQSVKQPLSEAVLQGDIPGTERILGTLQPIGILSRADVVLPSEQQGLRVNFSVERPVPAPIERLFELPIQISVPLYSLDQVSANSPPLASLVLRVDSFRMYQFIRDTFSTMLATYLLLALILSIAITWCMNRLIVHPLRAIARELQELPPDRVALHQLPLLERHQDDELGQLVRSYNRNQQSLAKAYADMGRLSTRDPVSGLADRALFGERLKRHIGSTFRSPRFSLLLVALRPVVGKSAWQQRVIPRLQGCLAADDLLVQIDEWEFALLAINTVQPAEALRLAQRIVDEIGGLAPASANPAVSIGIARFERQDTSAEQLMSEASSALRAAQRHGANHVVLFSTDLTH